MLRDVEANTSPSVRLAHLGLELPAVSPPRGSYVPTVRSGNLVFVAGQVPMVDGEVVETGRVGAEVTPQRAKELSRRCALAALAAVDAAVGLDKVTRVVKVLGFVSSADDFTQQASVIDGASDLFVAVFGDAGRHARSAVGVAILPLNAPVEIEIVVEVAD
ncbi:RidA family protein [Micromonospora sp. NPDC049171]|uniref:RidA family protein n=1 Tax=Micromonospora sp. NPDC049171 TaxID=3155770 RepID=UPI0033C49E10